MIEIFYEDPLVESFDKGAVSAFVEAVAISFASTHKMQFSITFVDEESIRMLNKDFRDKDKPTDVLTFCLTEGDSFFPSDMECSELAEDFSLGDIVICQAVVKEHAEIFHVSMEEELQRVIIHGILHLLGKNHETNDANEPMLLEQEYLLKEFRGLSLLGQP
ncbi:rRNA maturation RNase YbeY [Entomospira entomophila]|uniref:Endoribonuclease YbeY n=1 Tax=Entomospira entomophila TaxID=2719988 RepID=A0A968KRJ3_9SPIO|nr:rRNA maturation RNase YbeY [Entomospira entomophilus]NIZ40814.1 rRNA maturation RNase YbeY [Entomospira entomophilus]WDI35026.1 rRNA maturation RNase YbeY [Entomospira entomophilus]